MTVKFKKIFLILFFIIISLDKANAITFAFNELSNCVENYGSFKQFKNNFKTCYERKNVILNEEAINKIESKKNILNKLIEKDINKLLDTNASPDDIFSQPSVFSPDYLTGKYYLDNNSLTIIEEYASKNPTYIYGITEDINILAYEDQFISLKQRKELLLNIYNSFDVGLLLKAAKKITKLETSKDIPKKIIKKKTVVKKSKPTFLEKLKELTKRDKNKKTPKVKTKKVVLSSDKKKDKKKKKKIEIIKTNPRLIYLLPVVALAAAASSGGSSGNSTPTLSYSVSSASLGECDSAATFTGILTSAHSSNVTVSITTSGTATDGADYNLSSTTLTINSVQQQDQYQLHL